jgi:hypothetical protein
MKKMAKKKSGTKLVNEPVLTLKDVVKGTQSEAGFVYTFVETYEPLVKAGLAEINHEMTDGEAVATRATEAGIAYYDAHKEEFETPDAPAPEQEKVEKPKETVKMDYEIESGIEIPSPRAFGSASRASIYPFDKLEVGQSFFLPAAPDDKIPAVKKYASTVNSANQRYAIPDPTGATRTITRGPNMGQEVPATVQERHFVIREAEKNGVKGARIWRDK